MYKKIALTGLLVASQVSALARLKPDSIPSLTTITNYTLYSLCEKLHNPDPFFDERVK